MTHLLIPAKSEVCTSDCRGGQIWNPGPAPTPARSAARPPP